MVGYHIIVERDKGRKTPEVNFFGAAFHLWYVGFYPKPSYIQHGRAICRLLPYNFLFFGPRPYPTGVFLPKNTDKMRPLTPLQIPRDML